ncbi:pyridoxamine 5'-phosphate oxidase family protein [Actinoplanes sp. NBRC 101535]|uniref:pyridoxamine 5'-phosphate oxidase family protein n=1 Tax=Actinoplanes sp. NBRC 101535 TaxID=3032196 RepID=UPI0024A0D29F|nr:pyridoxamine 5'-phosphate oxidase family protein [Actinoplanes sp. NBRC 101535]GLY05842.1 hypothetical protein Acsp01_62210 [Actinoplanes sp. NBRC 101535]
MSDLILRLSVGEVLDSYRTCEFATLTRSGAPVAWPTTGIVAEDGTFLLTTSIGLPQKAFNVRRDPRVALLFSDPLGSGLANPEQILVRGEASCPDEIRAAPSGDLARLWARLMERQPSSQAYLDWPATKFTDFYFMRLVITVTPTEIVNRPLPEFDHSAPQPHLLGADVLAGYPSVVLTAVDESGAPVLHRTTVTAEDGGFRVVVPANLPVAAGPAGLLVHTHDEKLAKLHSASVRGTLTADERGWLLVPERLVEPGGRRGAGALETVRTLRGFRAATRRYLDKRGWDRPEIPWRDYRAIRATVRKS